MVKEAVLGEKTQIGISQVTLCRHSGQVLVSCIHILIQPQQLMNHPIKYFLFLFSIEQGKLRTSVRFYCFLGNELHSYLHRTSTIYQQLRYQILVN